MADDADTQRGASAGLDQESWADPAKVEEYLNRVGRLAPRLAGEAVLVEVLPLGEFDLIVSGFAIHHLDDERKRALFDEVAGALRLGGIFANLELVASATPQLHATFRAAVGREDDDPEDQLVDVETQLRWMRQAGMQHVDCLWRWRGFALLVGEADTSPSART